jgi:two-component system chemotaxis response regulator CheB
VIRVLVIDDSALVRKLFGRVFATESDFEVEFARDGRDGLAKLHAFKPHVATLDINMPHMDGLECLDRIMVEHPCPVVMVSSLSTAGADATLEALRLGAVDFVTKPSGAVSLQMDSFAPQLIEKVRAAAATRLRASARLRERVKHRFGAQSHGQSRPGGARANAGIVTPASGAGVVLIGTSTGGPPALEAVLTGLPASFPWPIVIAQHMPASFTGPLANRLDGLCAINVREVARATPLDAGCAYIARGDADIVLTRRDGVLTALSVSPHRTYPWHPSAERLVTSAMEHVAASQIVGVLMTGMGVDGAAAMAALHAQGGRTIAEAEDTAVVWGMPGELVRLNGAGWITPLQKIADQLEELVPHAAHP